MRILYIFPHPDDESFGPVPAIARQIRAGHEVYLLTLTRGEATRQRQVYGYTLSEMGKVREAEMRDVARVLGLADLTVMDFPDGRLSELDPRMLEARIVAHIRLVEPEIIVTYPAHGISCHPDHTVTHTVVKRVFCEEVERPGSTLRRLAFFTLPPAEGGRRPKHLRSSPLSRISCVVVPDEQDFEIGRSALACYKTYQAVVEAHDPLAQVREGVAFELFGEHIQPPLTDLTRAIPANTHAIS